MAVISISMIILYRFDVRPSSRFLARFYDTPVRHVPLSCRRYMSILLRSALSRTHSLLPLSRMTEFNRYATLSTARAKKEEASVSPVRELKAQWVNWHARTDTRQTASGRQMRREQTAIRSFKSRSLMTLMTKRVQKRCLKNKRLTKSQ